MVSTAHRGVLVVEDDDDIRDAIVDVLSDHGFEATGAANGLMALKMLNNSPERPLAIVLDLMMPVMDGNAFRTNQLAIPELAQIPVIVVSAYRDAEARAESLKAAAVLKKPLQMRELLEVLMRVCGDGGSTAQA